MNQFSLNPKEMNPENQPNLQKPNLERIADIINPSKSNIAILETLNNLLEGISTGNLSFPYNQNLEILLSENELESFKSDFYFIDLFLGLKNIVFSIREESNQKYKYFCREILDSFKFFFEEKGNFSIELKSLKKKVSVSINNPKILEEISEVMQEKLSELFFNAYIKDRNLPEYIKNDMWGYMKGLLAEEMTFYNKKGRKKNPISTGFNIDLLQKYLQKYTGIKAESGISISRKQAGFIFEFLKIMGLIQSSEVWKEDIIRHTLNSFRKIGNLESI